MLGRFLSADSIVPGAASGSGGGAGTLGYDSSSRLTTLTTDFHEFIGKVTQENQAVLQYGPFFQWSEKVRRDNPVPSGPLNPQALNRYSYVLNNPLRYVDPTGHDGSIEFTITFNDEELIKYFIQAVRDEADFLVWRGQELSTKASLVTWAGGGILAPSAIAAKVSWGLVFGWGTAMQAESLLVGGIGGGDVGAQLKAVANILSADLKAGSSLKVRIDYSGGMIMTMDTGKHVLRLNCITQCAAAQMGYILNAMLNDSVAWKYNMLSVRVGQGWNNNYYNDALLSTPIYP